MLSRRDWLLRTAAGTAAALVARAVAPAELLADTPRGVKPTDVVVYKSPTCGCCKQWVAHMEHAGYTITAHEMADVTPIKRQLGVPEGLDSCHTAVVGKYVIEGHVPADLVQKLQREKPALLGLAVPGMVAGSPGMEMGARKDPYDVVAFDAKGKRWTYARR